MPVTVTIEYGSEIRFMKGYIRRGVFIQCKYKVILRPIQYKSKKSPIHIDDSFFNNTFSN